MAKQHDEELQRLRIDLEEMQQSSRKVHGQLSYLEVRSWSWFWVYQGVFV